jgi:hypothetical protein
VRDTSVPSNAAAAALAGFRAPIDLDLWSRLSVPTTPSGAIKGTLFLGVKPRKSGATSSTADDAPDSGSSASSGSDADSDDATAAAAQAAAQAKSNPWNGEDSEYASSEWDSEGAELLPRGTQLPPLNAAHTVLKEQSAALSMAALALLALRSIASGEMSGKQTLLLVGSLFLVPLVHLIKG